MRIPLVVPLFKRFALYEKGMQPKTIREIKSIVNTLSDELSNPTIKSISTSKIRQFLHQKKQERMWSNKTFRNKRQYLKTFFDYCIREDFVKMNPVEKIEKPKVPKQLPRCLNKKQLDCILMHLDTHKWFNTLEENRNKAIIRTFLYTGIRLNELLKLKTSSINFEESEILIYEGKGNKDRIVPIHPNLMPYLKSYQDMKRKKPTIHFFSSIRSDSPLTENNLYRVIKILRKVTGVYFSPHMLRHTFGKLAIESDLNPFKLKQIMGHSDIQTTQIYISVSYQNIKESFQKLELI